MKKQPIPAPEAGKALPNAPVAERSVIGSVLIDPDGAWLSCGKLSEEHFYSERHRLIWRHIKALEQEGTQIDLVTLSEHMNARGTLEQIGGVEYLINLGDEIVTAAYAEPHANILEERLLMRKIVQQASNAVRLVQDGDLEQALNTISNPLELESCEEKTIHNAEVLKQLLLPQREDAVLSTGLPGLDEKIGGLRGGHFYVLAARPAMGKTMLALQIAANIAQNYRKGVLFASLEMPASELQIRLCAQVLGIHQERILKREAQAMELIKNQLPAFEQIPLYYEDNQDMNLRDLELAARKQSRQEGGLGLIVVDYLQLIEIGGENRNEEIGKISRSLKRLSRRLDIPVVALSQLSRKLESRPDKRPMLSDLRDSGAVEQDADVVMFIYRDEYYNPNTAEPGIAEIIIGKQRGGQVGTLKMGFRGSSARFTPY